MERKDLMELIIGGAYQGKRAYANNLYTISTSTYLDGETCAFELKRVTGMYHLHRFIYRLLKEGKDPMRTCEQLIEKNPHIIFISDEIGYGIVAMDAFDRIYRETCGRVCCMLAQKAKRVHRVVCGIGSVIKDV